MKVLTAIFLVLLALNCPAQKTPKKEWTHITSPKKDLSVSMPPDFLIYNEDGNYRAYTTFGGVDLTVWMRETKSAKLELKASRKNAFESEYNVSRFEKGDFEGDIKTFEKDGVYLTEMMLASSKASYRLSVHSKDKSNPVLEKFLYSIKLENLPLFKQTTSVQTTDSVVSVETLKTSPIILQALITKDAEKLKIKYDLKDKQEYTNRTDTANYSRALVILSKPRAKYTDMGRSNNVSGEIMLKVLFRADGQIGDVTVLKKLGSGLDEEAVNAVRKVKFLPAEINGKPVDIIRQLSYSFTIY